MTNQLSRLISAIDALREFAVPLAGEKLEEEERTALVAFTKEFVSAFRASGLMMPGVPEPNETEKLTAGLQFVESNNSGVLVWTEVNESRLYFGANRDGTSDENECLQIPDGWEKSLGRLRGTAERTISAIAPQRANGEVGANPPANPSADGTRATGEAKPQKLLTGWQEITNALGMKYADRGKIKSLNERCEGPITNQGRGTQPMANSDSLIEWWNSLAIRQQELANRREGKKASAEAQHYFGRDGTAAPEIAGGVKKRRRTQST